MTSQLNVDTIKGKTTEGSITVQGEGSATTNLQQGLAKMFAEVETQSSNDLSSDSLNNSSFTDTAAGKGAFNLTNVMNNADFIGHTTCGVSSSSAYYGSSCNLDDYNQNRSTSIFHYVSVRSSNTISDFKSVQVTAFGDLA